MKADSDLSEKELLFVWGGVSEVRGCSSLEPWWTRNPMTDGSTVVDVGARPYVSSRDVAVSESAVLR